MDSISGEISGSGQTEAGGCKCSDPVKTERDPQWKRVSGEIVKATLMVTKFMGLAFLITALITFYVPQNLISGIVSGSPVVQVILATLIGIPMYTSNITALPVAGGLLDLGLNKGAAHFGALFTGLCFNLFN